MPSILSDILQATPGDKVLYISFAIGAVITCLIAIEQLKGQARFAKWIKWGIRVFSGLLLADYLLLVYLFLKSDFTYNYVWSFSERNLPAYYKAAAALAGQQGTFLFWAAIIGAGALWLNEKRESASDFIRKTHVIVLLIGLFFIFLTLKESPFKSIYQLYPDLPKSFVPEDGNGLNPLLIDPWMAVHPLVMFIGYASVTNPFAISVVYLYKSIKGRGAEIERVGIKNVVQFCRVAWFFLTFAIAIGGFWAYKVLGWGGFWAWDPVETASLIPWLMLTASMHSLVEHRRNRRKYAILAPVLVCLSFSLVLYATLVTRSGFFESVHSFAAGTTGSYLLAMIALATAVPLILAGVRYVRVEDERAIEGEELSLVSRTNIFYVSILFLVMLTYISVWGITYPALLKLFASKKVGIGPAFFNLWSYPFFIGLFLLAGLCLNYRSSRRETCVKEFLAFTALTLLAALIRPGEAWNIVDYSAIITPERPLLYKAIGGASALSFIPPMVYIVYGVTRRYEDLVKPSKKRDYTVKELGVLAIHLGIVFITIGGVFSTLFTTEFSATASMSQKGRVSQVPETPYGLALLDYKTVVDYGREGGQAVEKPPPGIPISQLLSEVESGRVRESYTVRGVIKSVQQTEHITYVKLVGDGRELWVAIEKTPEVPKDINVAAQGTLMFNFPSPTLNRTFNIILFANRMEQYEPQERKKPYTTTEEYTFAVYENGRKIAEGVTRNIKYRNGKASRVMIDRGFLRDVYVIFNGASGDSVSATVKLKPLINELWFGVILLMAGIAVVFFFDPAQKAGV